MNKFIAGLALTVLLAAGCASIPRPLEGEVSAVAPEESSDHDVGQTVRWGGQIVDTRPGRSETCIEVLSQPLDKRARPIAGDGHHGRFLACREGFEDPAVFETGRDLTVLGELTGFVEGHIGEFQYIYPRVDSRTLYLWPDEVVIHHDTGPWLYYDPWWPYVRYPMSRSRWQISGSVILTD